MSQPLQVLIVEDSASDAAMVVRLLRGAGYDVHDERVGSAGEMQAALDKQAWDVVIADYRLPQFDAPAALALLQQAGLDVPFIVVSGTIGGDAVVAMMKAGAHDYLMKDRLARLAPAVEQEMREAQTRRERREAQAALRASEERTRITLMSVADGVIAADAGGQVTMMNPVAEALTGWKNEEACGKPLEEIFCIVNEETRRPVENPVVRVLREGLVVGLANHTLLIARDGTERPIADSGAPIHDETGQITGVVLVFCDQTAERAAQRALRESERKLKQAQAIGRIGSWEFNVESQAITWSDQTYELYGRDPALGPPTVEEEAAYYSPEQHRILKEYARRAVEEGRDFEYDLEVELPGRKHFYFSATMKPIKDAHGRVVRLFGTVQDITERKRAEVQLNEQLDELRRWHAVTLGREMRVLDLKREVNELLAQTGQPPRYEDPKGLQDL